MGKAERGNVVVSLDLVDFVPHNRVRINPFSASLNYSHAIFEGLSIMKVDNHLHLFHPWLNLERMRHNADEVGISMEGFGTNGIIGSIFALAAMNGYYKNDFYAPTIKRAGKDINRFYVRPLLYVESDTLGLGSKMTPHMLISIVPMGEYLNCPKEKGVETMLFPYERNLPLPGIKTAANYQIGIISRRKMEFFNKANNENCVETLFVNPKGFLIEGSGENIVVIRDNELISPHPDQGAVPGITLRMISAIAKKFGIGFRFGVFKLNDLRETDCLFLCGNAAGIVPVSSIAEVDKDYSLIRHHYFRSAENELLRLISNEFEMMESASSGYAGFHTGIDQWLEEEEMERLYSYGLKLIRKSEIADMQDQLGANNVPPPNVVFTGAMSRREELTKYYGMRNFYS